MVRSRRFITSQFFDKVPGDIVPQHLPVLFKLFIIVLGFLDASGIARVKKIHGPLDPDRVILTARMPIRRVFVQICEAVDFGKKGCFMAQRLDPLRVDHLIKSRKIFPLLIGLDGPHVQFRDILFDFGQFPFGIPDGMEIFSHQDIHKHISVFQKRPSVIQFAFNTCRSYLGRVKIRAKDHPLLIKIFRLL